MAAGVVSFIEKAGTCNPFYSSILALLFVLFRLSPTSEVPLRVKAAISPQDVGKLKEGQKVQMRVSACPYPDYGTLKGVVSQISRDTIKPQNNSATTSQKGSVATAFYEVTIKPENLSLGRGKKRCSIQLGMEGRADIVTREDTVLKFLLRKARLMTDL